MYLPLSLFHFGPDKYGAFVELWARRCDAKGTGTVDSGHFVSSLPSFGISKACAKRWWAKGAGSPRFKRYEDRIWYASRHKCGQFVNVPDEVLEEVKTIGDFTALASAVTATATVGAMKGAIERGRTLRTIGLKTGTPYKSTPSARCKRAKAKGWLERSARYVEEHGVNWRIRNDYGTDKLRHGKDKFAPSVKRDDEKGAMRAVKPKASGGTVGAKLNCFPGWENPAGYSGMMDRICGDRFSRFSTF